MSYIMFLAHSLACLADCKKGQEKMTPFCTAGLHSTLQFSRVASLCLTVQAAEAVRQKSCTHSNKMG